eukprot:m.69407 g.69407  ORF g.69407 m.69407 type:complete len:116 (+) comp8581_c0_seq3:494-841(+)
MTASSQNGYMAVTAASPSEQGQPTAHPRPQALTPDEEEAGLSHDPHDTDDDQDLLAYPGKELGRVHRHLVNGGFDNKFDTDQLPSKAVAEILPYREYVTVTKAFFFSFFFPLLCH